MVGHKVMSSHKCHIETKKKKKTPLLTHCRGDKTFKALVTPIHERAVPGNELAIIRIKQKKWMTRFGLINLKLMSFKKA